MAHRLALVLVLLLAVPVSAQDREIEAGAGLWLLNPLRGGCPAGSRKSAATATHYPTFCRSARAPSSSSRCAFSIHICSYPVMRR